MSMCSSWDIFPCLWGHQALFVRGKWNLIGGSDSGHHVSETTDTSLLEGANFLPLGTPHNSDQGLLGVGWGQTDALNMPLAYPTTKGQKGE